MKRGISVIICCYNSANRLPVTLRHIAAQRVSAIISWEVIIIDNASVDDTAEIARREWGLQNCKVSFQIINQPIPGLAAARKTGIGFAQFDYILFCDDDNWLANNYVQRAFFLMEANQDIGVLGGIGIPATDAENLPIWFYNYAFGYAVGVQAIKSGDISSRGFVWGAGAVMRRKLLADVVNAGNDFLLSGRKGSVLTAGDDSEICRWFLLAGYKLWYDEKLVFHHFIPKERLSIDYLENQHKGFEAAREVMTLYDRYIYRRINRKRWSKDPARWLLSELRFFLSRAKFKGKLVSLAKNIERLSVCR